MSAPFFNGLLSGARGWRAVEDATHLWYKAARKFRESTACRTWQPAATQRERAIEMTLAAGSRKEACVSREDLIQIEGVVKEVMAGGQFRVESEKGQQFFAKISGRMRRFHIKVIPGDRVTVAVSPYDPTHGLIVYRST